MQATSWTLLKEGSWASEVKKLSTQGFHSKKPGSRTWAKSLKDRFTIYISRTSFRLGRAVQSQAIKHRELVLTQRKMWSRWWISRLSLMKSSSTSLATHQLVRAQSNTTSRISKPVVRTQDRQAHLCLRQGGWRIILSISWISCNRSSSSSIIWVTSALVILNLSTLFLTFRITIPMDQSRMLQLSITRDRIQIYHSRWAQSWAKAGVRLRECRGASKRRGWSSCRAWW